MALRVLGNPALDDLHVCRRVKHYKSRLLVCACYVFLSPALLAEVAGDPFSHVGPLTFDNPSDGHFAGSERSGKSEGYSGRVSSEPLSPRHTREGCKSCCPLVMTEHE